MFVCLFVCFVGKTGNKILVPDIRFKMCIKHPAVGYFVWSLGVVRVLVFLLFYTNDKCQQ